MSKQKQLRIVWHYLLCLGLTQVICQPIGLMSNWFNWDWGPVEWLGLPLAVCVMLFSFGFPSVSPQRPKLVKG